MPQILTRKFTVAATTSGVEVDRVLNAPGRPTGYLKQILIRKSSGSATNVDIQLRYESGNSFAENVIYEALAATFSSDVYVDGDINSPFSLLAVNISGIGEKEELRLYLEPDADSTLEVRLDFEILST